MPASTTGRPAAVLSILVTANTRAAQANMAALNRQAAYTARGVHASATLMDRALAAVKFGSVALGAGIAGSVAAAVQFEQEFANVKKTVAATPQEFKKVRTGILDLSEKIPESANSLADLAGEAGALGVKAKQLVGFTKTASMLGTATTMTSQEAADSLARLGNIMDQRTNPAFRHMGSTLVALGNKGASTESEIAAMSLRIAGAGKQVGLTSAQVLGLGAALANLGIRSEMGGSAISRVMLAMNAAIAKGGDELQVWAKTADMSAQQFADTFKKDPTTAIAAFSEGLGKIGKSGGDVTAVLNQLGDAAHTSMNEIRVRDTLLRVASNTDQFRTSLDQANTAWDKNNALTTEAHKRYQTLSSQLTLLKNSITRTGIDIGTQLLPDLKDMVQIMRDPKLSTEEKISGVLDKLSDMIEEFAPKLAAIGAKMTFNIAKGMFEAFGKTDNPLVKIFETAAFIRIIGGPGALRALGASIGRLVGVGTVTGMSTTLAAEAGGAAGAGAGAGAAGAEVGALTGMAKWKAKFSNFGKVVLGGALGYGILSGLSGTLTEGANRPGDVLGIAHDFSTNLIRSFGIPTGQTIAEQLDANTQAAIDNLTNVSGNVKRIQSAIRSERQGLYGNQGILKGSAADVATFFGLPGSQNWDDYSEESQAAMKKVARRLQAEAQGLEEFGIDIPVQFDAPSRSKVEHNIATLRGGLLRGMDDIQRVMNKNRGIIAKTVGSDSKEGRRLLADNMRAAAVAVNLSMEKSGHYTKEGMERIQSLIRQADILTAGSKQARGFAREWSKGIDETKEVTRQGINNVIKKIDQLPPATRDSATKAMLTQLSIAHKHNQLSDKVYGNMVSHIVAHFSDMDVKSTRRTASMAGAVSTIVAGMVNAVSGKGGFKSLETNVNKALSSFGTGKGDKVSFSTVKAAAKSAGSFLGGILGGQHGMVAKVPGHTAGDRHILSLNGVPIAKVESTEGIFVGNRTATNAYEHLNAVIPRKSKGGGIIAAGRLAQSMGLVPTENPAFGGVTPGAHASGSYHYSGQAIDVVGGGGPGSGSWSNYVGAVRRGWLGKGLAEEFYDLLPNYVKNDQIIPGQFGDHADHIHVAILGAALGGATAIQKLKRIILKGPKGPLRTSGQGALDKAWKAANAYLQKHSGSITASAEAGGQYNKASLANLWRKTGSGGDANLMAAIALAESGGNPQADNGIARGLWQIISGTWSAYGKGSWDNAFNPVLNAEAAHRILAAGGLGQWDAYTNGSYQSYLQRGGLAWGGWHGKGGKITARRPTLIGIGERGTETAVVTPGGPGGGGDVHVHTHTYVDGNLGPMVSLIRTEVEDILADDDTYKSRLGKAGM